MLILYDIRWILQYPERWGHVCLWLWLFFDFAGYPMFALAASIWWELKVPSRSSQITWLKEILESVAYEFIFLVPCLYASRWYWCAIKYSSRITTSNVAILSICLRSRLYSVDPGTTSLRLFMGLDWLSMMLGFVKRPSIKKKSKRIWIYTGQSLDQSFRIFITFNTMMLSSGFSQDSWINNGLSKVK